MRPQCGKTGKTTEQRPVVVFQRKVEHLERQVRSGNGGGFDRLDGWGLSAEVSRTFSRSMGPNWSSHDLDGQMGVLTALDLNPYRQGWEQKFEGRVIVRVWERFLTRRVVTLLAPPEMMDAKQMGFYCIQ